MKTNILFRTGKDRNLCDVGDFFQSAEPRRVMKGGIRYNGIYYQSPGLMPFIGRRVKVCPHPDNAGVLFVFGLEGGYICTALGESIDALSLADYVAKRMECSKNINQRRTVYGFNHGSWRK